MLKPFSQVSSEVSSGPTPAANATEENPMTGTSSGEVTGTNSEQLLQNQVTEKSEADAPEQTESKPLDTALETDFFSSGFAFAESAADEKDSIKPRLLRFN